MAFRSKRFGRRRRFGGSRKVKTRWTGDFLTDPQVTAGQASTTFALLAPSDYEVSTLLEPGGGARCERIVGALSMYATVGVAEFAAGIWAIDSVAAGGIAFGGSYDPGVFNSIRNGDLMWWTCGLTQPLPGEILRIEWDIKVRRKLEDTVIILVVSDYAAAANTITWHAGFRVLLANA